MKRLAWITVSVIYLLMFWGNLVSSTGSGLACPDWPTCRGTLTPPVLFETVMEWGHRLLAATASVFMLITVIRILIDKKLSQNVKRAGKTLIALVTIQILLGATTVLLGLSVAVSTIHLIVANIVFAGFISFGVMTTWENPIVSGEPEHVSKMRRLGIAAIAGMLIQLALGALVRHGHAGLACPKFPSCSDSFWPSPFIFETIVAFTHRWWGIVLVGVFAHISAHARKRLPALKGPARTLFFISLFQVTLGISTVLRGLPTVERAIHAAVGYAIWGLVFFISFRSGAFRWIWRTE